jgi:hypothetical protein
LYLYRDRVRILAGLVGAEHLRQWQPEDSSIVPEHRAERVAAVSGTRARMSARRAAIIASPSRIGRRARRRARSRSLV